MWYKLIAYSYSCMTRNVKEALGLKERKGAATSSIFEEVAQDMKVDPGFVQKITKKRRAALREKESKRLKQSRA